MNDLLKGIVSRARTILQELDTVISVKLVRQGQESNVRIKRRAWMRYRSKVNSLHDRLKEARITLVEALSADVW
jgi:hypothetical protein